MHPLVRDLYKRVLHVGQDYPTGIEHVKKLWKEAIKNTQNCPSCYDSNNGKVHVHFLDCPGECHEELLRAVYRGRRMVKEMIGVIQLKKYRTMNKRYGTLNSQQALRQAIADVEKQATGPATR